MATSDLAVEAAKAALEDAGITPDEVDLIILGTDSPDYITPATSVVVQEKLGAKKAGTFDVGCACASFPTGLALGAGLISTNPHMKHVLVIGAYLMHRLADYKKDVISFFTVMGQGSCFSTQRQTGFRFLSILQMAPTIQTGAFMLVEPQNLQQSKMFNRARLKCAW